MDTGSYKNHKKNRNLELNIRLFNLNLWFSSQFSVFILFTYVLYGLNFSVKCNCCQLFFVTFFINLFIVRLVPNTKKCYRLSEEIKNFE